MDVTGRKITKIAREASRLVNITMRETGVGSGEFDLIHCVRHQPGISQKEISAQLNMDKGAVARRVASLEQKGYLRRCDNPEDGRSQLIYPTVMADSLKKSKADVETAFYSWLLEDFTSSEQQQFTYLLMRLYDRSKNERRNGFIHVLERIRQAEEDGNNE